MFPEIKKSFQSILYERTTSPLFGTFIASWLLWKWRIIYLTLFISEDKITIDKISYITRYCSNKHLLITGPLLSTFLLITIIPFLSNGAFWLELYFNSWKKRKKNEFEMKQLITLEQSIELREQIINQDKRFEKLIEEKNNEITTLNSIITNYQKSSNFDDEPPIDITLTDSEKNEIVNQNSKNEIIQIVDRLNRDINLLNQYKEILRLIQHTSSIVGRDAIPTKAISFFESHDIISAKSGGVYTLTEKGKSLNRALDENLLI